MELNSKEKEKYLIIKKIIQGELSKKEAETKLKISRRQIDRLIVKFNAEGENGFIHKNKGKISKNKTPEKLIEEIENLYLNEYYDYNLKAFYEELIEKYSYDVSYSLILTSFKKDDIISPYANNKTIKLYNEKMKKAIKNNDENISEEKKTLYETRKIAYEQAHVRRPSNLYFFGQEVQMDAAFDIWFGGIVSALHLAVDKGTKKVLFGWFEYEEITRGYFVVLLHIILNYGIPKRIKADNRSSFNANNNKKKKSLNTTQFGNICDYLGIELQTTSVATAKANVERENGTFKRRLKAELRHEGIININGANKYINEVFIPKINKKFSYEIDKNTSQMRENNYSYEELNLIISEKYKRIIDNASSVQYNHKYYLLCDIDTGEVTCFKNKTECTFIIAYDSTYWCMVEDKYYMLIEIESRDKTMKKEDENKMPVERKKYIPPADHPWRKGYKKITSR
jgi:transposase